LINRTAAAEGLEDAKNVFAQKHGKNIIYSILSGFAAVAPRTATPNLIELLSTFLTRFPLQSKQWVNEILYSVSVILYILMLYHVQSYPFEQPDFTPSKATTEAKDKFVKIMFR
jgi:hypothetical protein